jgi:hypothetical protein
VAGSRPDQFYRPEFDIRRKGERVKWEKSYICRSAANVRTFPGQLQIYDFSHFLLSPLLRI